MVQRGHRPSDDTRSAVPSNSHGSRRKSWLLTHTRVMVLSEEEDWDSDGDSDWEGVSGAKQEEHVMHCAWMGVEESGSDVVGETVAVVRPSSSTEYEGSK